ncbi:hypothetical protein DFJ74DRAFT_673176 [Hyaloraphidium curvatum]|nr:hypothetical protein DFJ74DRAFT_673176 [Hyaloraphidium curvatum]
MAFALLCPEQERPAISFPLFLVLQQTLEPDREPEPGDRVPRPHPGRKANIAPPMSLRIVPLQQVSLARIGIDCPAHREAVDRVAPVPVDPEQPARRRGYVIGAPYVQHGAVELLPRAKTLGLCGAVPDGIERIRVVPAPGPVRLRELVDGGGEVFPAGTGVVRRGRGRRAGRWIPRDRQGAGGDGKGRDVGDDVERGGRDEDGVQAVVFGRGEGGGGDGGADEAAENWPEA